MKHTLVLSLALLLIFAPILFAQTFFDENFDNDPPYMASKPPPTGVGKINFGSWTASFTASPNVVEISEEKSLSAPASLLIGFPEEEPDLERVPQVWGQLGLDNQSLDPVRKPLRISFAFLLDRVNGSDGECATFAVLRQGGQPFLLVLLGADGSVIVRGPGATGGVEILAQIEPDKWYVVEVRLPAPDFADGATHVELFETTGEGGKGKSLGGGQGPPPPVNAAYGSFLLSVNFPGMRVWFDNLRAEALVE